MAARCTGMCTAQAQTAELPSSRHLCASTSGWSLELVQVVQKLINLKSPCTSFIRNHPQHVGHQGGEGQMGIPACLPSVPWARGWWDF